MLWKVIAELRASLAPSIANGLENSSTKFPEHKNLFAVYIPELVIIANNCILLKIKFKFSQFEKSLIFPSFKLLW